MHACCANVEWGLFVARLICSWVSPEVGLLWASPDLPTHLLGSAARIAWHTHLKLSLHIRPSTACWLPVLPVLHAYSLIALPGNFRTLEHCLHLEYMEQCLLGMLLSKSGNLMDSSHHL